MTVHVECHGSRHHSHRPNATCMASSTPTPGRGRVPNVEITATTRRSRRAQDLTGTTDGQRQLRFRRVTARRATPTSSTGAWNFNYHLRLQLPGRIESHQSWRRPSTSLVLASKGKRHRRSFTPVRVAANRLRRGDVKTVIAANNGKTRTRCSPPIEQRPDKSSILDRRLVNGQVQT